MHFQALRVEIDERGFANRQVVERTISDLPDGDVLVKVAFSSLNYKDALSAAGNRGVTKQYPHTPGIDAAGVVISSRVPEFSPGDEVLSISPELGVSTPGGFGQFIRVPADWLMHAPEGLTLHEAMAYGTAGFTAALCVSELQAAGVEPAMGEVLVTGATGGVGSVAVGLLAREGYPVVAATSKMDRAETLRKLGAAEVVDRETVNDQSSRPLLNARWAGVVDTVGGNYLATALRAARPNGVVTACGNAASPDLTLTVYPFILRGIRLVGIDATRTPIDQRSRLWRKLGQAWKLEEKTIMARDVSLEGLSEEIERMLHGELSGRIVVNLIEVRYAKSTRSNPPHS